MTLQKVISGGQNGVDIAALIAAKRCGIQTGGTMPRGFKTLDGPMLSYAKRFGMIEHQSSTYPPRTQDNVYHSNATLRIAANFNSPGERCTMKFITIYRRPRLDVGVRKAGELFISDLHPEQVAEWIVTEKVKILNVAGNSENTCLGIQAWTIKFLTSVFENLKE